MAEATIKVTIRQNSGAQFDVQVNPKGTVKDLKEACASQAGISAEEQRLIFKGKNSLSLRDCVGKILKDENTLEEYKIEDGVTVHLVKGKSASASGASGESSSGAQASSSSSGAGAGAGAGAGLGAGAGGLGGLGGFGGFGGLGGMGGMGGFPGMAAGGGPSGMGGLGGMNPAMM
jgi:ubiquilin